VIKLGLMDDLMKDLYSRHMIMISRVRESEAHVYNVARVIRDYLLAKDPGERDKQYQKMLVLKSKAEESLKIIKNILISESEQKDYEKIRKELDNYFDAAELVIVATNQTGFLNLSEVQYSALRKAREKITIVDNSMSDFSGKIERSGKEFYENGKDIYFQSMNILIIFTFLGVVIGILFGVFISNIIIKKPINNLMKKFDNIFKMDLSHKRNGVDDEIIILTNYINIIADQ
jgi:hypothetical protein